jgi:GDPmannose 4,6-dehydratase
MKKALITGVTGQDGSYLSSLLLSLGYQVYGAVRRTSNLNKERLNYFDLLENKYFKVIELDLTDLASLQNFFREYHVDEVYNLAAQSFVGLSFQQPILTANITGLGPLYLLEAIKNTGKKIRFYQASSSELFGKVQETPQTENTPFYPRSPYGTAKLFAHWSSVNYRESYDMYTSNGILFNHESPLRGEEFVTRKITSNVAKIKKGMLKKISLGNLNAKRDWGYAGDYVKAMFKMLQNDTPEDFVISTGITKTVRDFVKFSFNFVDIDIYFEGNGLDEKGIDSKTGKILLDVSKDFYRPAEVDLLIGDSTKAKKILNWSCETPLDVMIKMMINYDLMLLDK